MRIWRRGSKTARSGLSRAARPTFLALALTSSTLASSVLAQSTFTGDDFERSGNLANNALGDQLPPLVPSSLSSPLPTLIAPDGSTNLLFGVPTAPADGGQNLVGPESVQEGGPGSVPWSIPGSVPGSVPGRSGFLASSDLDLPLPGDTADGAALWSDVGGSPAQTRPSPVNRLADETLDRTLITGSLGGAAQSSTPQSAPILNQPIAPVPDAANITTPRRADPFAATGLRLGGFTLFPVLETAVGYTSNRDKSAGGSGSAYAQTTPSVTLETGGSDHQLRVTGSATVERSFSGDEGTDVTASVTASGQVNLSDVSQITGSLSYGFSAEDSSEQASGETILGTNAHALSGRVAYERTAGLVGLRLSTDVDYTLYEGGETVGGADFTASSDRNNLFVRPAARASLSPGAVLEPFVEVGGRARFYENTSSSAGLDRNAYGFDVAAGLSIDSGGDDRGGSLVSGEVAVGYIYEDAASTSLADISAVTISGSGSYRPSDILALNGDLSTTVSSTTLEGSAGSITYAAGVEAIYALRDNVDLSARMAGSYLTYSGPANETYEGSVGLGALYRVNRLLQVYGDYDFTRAQSTGSGASYNDHTLALGLRWQR